MRSIGLKIAAASALVGTLAACGTASHPRLIGREPSQPPSAVPQGPSGPLGATLGRSMNPGQVGFGEVRPSLIFLGGDPTGRVRNVSWSSWGGPRAFGTGIGFSQEGARAVAGGHNESAKVEAWDLGPCDGHRAYRKVEWYFPAEGDWIDTTNAMNICTWSLEQWQPELGRPWSPYVEGYGQVRPPTVSDGGSYNQVSHVIWTSWGGPRAVGSGYMRSSPTPTFSKVSVVAYDLGPCDGRIAYRKIAFPKSPASFDLHAQGFSICDAGEHP